jgi:hypothetical protein
VLCVFGAIDARMIRARADGMLDFAAACGRRPAAGRAARLRRACPPARRARRRRAARLTCRPVRGKSGRSEGVASKNWPALANGDRFLGSQPRRCGTVPRLRQLGNRTRRARAVKALRLRSP